MSLGKTGRGNVKKVNKRNARIYYHEAFLLIINFNLYFPLFLSLIPYPAQFNYLVILICVRWEQE